MATLYVMCGVPGSGKSTVANKINARVVSSDTIRGNLWGDENAQWDDSFLSKFACVEDLTDKQKRSISNTVVFGIMQNLVISYLENGIDVIADCTNLDAKSRKRWINLHNIANKIVAVVMTTPYEECVRRNNNRQRVVPIKVIDEMYKAYKMPTKDEGFDKILYDTDV